ncbi:MAG: ATP-binding protein [Chloroflexota bacterium]
MRIRRLHVQEFRRHHELELDFAPGLTVVRGPNEAGKSSIQRAIELALTRRVTSSAGDLDALRPWDALPDVRSVISLDFEQEEEDGVKAGTVRKVFAGAKGSVELTYEGQSITDPAQADQVLAELTGIPSEAFFRSTASIRHHEVSDLDHDESALRDRLQASISGADRGTSRARKTLDKAIHELSTQGPKNPGHLKVATEAVAAETAAVQQGEAALAQLQRDRDTLSDARERRAHSEASLAERRAMLEKARQAERLGAERDNAKERFERLRQAVEVSVASAHLADTHPSANPLPVLRQIVERLRKLDSRIRELRAALADDVEVAFHVPPEPTWRPLSRWAIVLVLIGLAVAVSSVALDTAGIVAVPPQVQFVGAIAAGIGFILAFVAWWLRRNDRMETQLRDIDIDRRLRGRSEMEQELREAEADTATQLEGLGLADFEAAQALLDSEEDHVRQIERLEAELQGLVGREPPESLPKLRDAAALEIEQKSAAIEALGPIAKEPRARERLEVEVKDHEAGLERARDDEASARARVDANEVDAEQVAAHAERLERWRGQLAALERRLRVYVATLEAIDRAEVATMKSATRYLEKHMARNIAAVTEGRYRRVRVDDATLDVEVHAPERGDWVPVTALSQGTLDLIFLAARLGLVRLVTGDRRPPLVLDDPFVTLDGQRATRALELLRAVAGDFQVIYLTTSDRYDGVADAVRLLDGPTLVDADAGELAPDDGLPLALLATEPA